MSLRSFLVSLLGVAILLATSGCGDRETQDGRFAGTYKHTLATGSVTLELGADMKFTLIQGGAARKSTGAYSVNGETIILNVEEIDGQPVKQADREYPLTLTAIEGGVLKGPGELAFRKQ